MLFRFSLYGFLKNQRYFEPFLYLALMENGLSFFVIGLLIGFREIIVNVFEIPSGAIADTFGRRKAMILSFVAYTGSFILFGLAHPVWMFFLAMFFFAIGDAFRTGTHKALCVFTAAPWSPGLRSQRTWWPPRLAFQSRAHRVQKTLSRLGKGLRRKTGRLPESVLHRT